jgi:hypothetical protein
MKRLGILSADAAENADIVSGGKTHIGIPFCVDLRMKKYTLNTRDS